MSFLKGLKKRGLLLFYLFLPGCVHETLSTEHYAYSKVYYAPFQTVYAATKLALAKYPVIKDDPKDGVVETDLISPGKAWRAPIQGAGPISTYRYKIRVHIIRGSFYNRPSVKVTVFKHIEQKQDFFSEPFLIPSTGVEERIILYRVDREVKIGEAIERYEKNLERKKALKNKKKASEKAINEELASEETSSKPSVSTESYDAENEKPQD